MVTGTNVCDTSETNSLLDYQSWVNQSTEVLRYEEDTKCTSNGKLRSAQIFAPCNVLGWSYHLIPRGQAFAILYNSIYIYIYINGLVSDQYEIYFGFGALAFDGPITQVV
jgi:hypothetical protein